MKEAILIYASTEPGTPQFSADLLWRTKFRVPDPIMYIEIEGRGTLVASSLEFNRAKQESGVDVVLLDELFPEKGPRHVVSAIVRFLHDRDVVTLAVPATLPYALGKALAEHIELRTVPDSIFPARAKKTADEIREIEHAGEAVGRALEEARAVLRNARIVENEIHYDGIPLTSERLRNVIEKRLFADGYLGTNSIVSCGADAANPHAIGSGPVRPHEPIVCDIFPRSMATNYHADITRTFFKGEPSDALRSMYAAVQRAQRAGIEQVHSGIDAKKLQAAAEAVFNDADYSTVVSREKTEGFIHSLGHGVGLEVHELPHVGSISNILETGNVITIEPGLYYPIGGIRIEDMVVVEEAGGRVLAELPRDLAWAIIP